MQGYTDSVAFEFDSSILAKLHLVGVVTVAKNGLIFDDSLISEFITRKTKKGIEKQLKQLINLYQYLAILETQTGLKYKIMQAELSQTKKPVENYLLPIVTVEGLTGEKLYNHLKTRLKKLMILK